MARKKSAAGELLAFATNPLVLFVGALVGGGALLANAKAKTAPPPPPPPPTR